MCLRSDVCHPETQVGTSIGMVPVGWVRYKVSGIALHIECIAAVWLQSISIRGEIKRLHS